MYYFHNGFILKINIFCLNLSKEHKLTKRTNNIRHAPTSTALNELTIAAHPFLYVIVITNVNQWKNVARKFSFVCPSSSKLHTKR